MKRVLFFVSVTIMTVFGLVSCHLDEPEKPVPSITVKLVEKTATYLCVDVSISDSDAYYLYKCYPAAVVEEMSDEEIKRMASEEVLNDLNDYAADYLETNGYLYRRHKQLYANRLDPSTDYVVVAVVIDHLAKKATSMSRLDVSTVWVTPSTNTFIVRLDTIKVVGRDTTYQVTVNTTNDDPYLCLVLPTSIVQQVGTAQMYMEGLLAYYFEQGQIYSLLNKYIKYGSNTVSVQFNNVHMEEGDLISVLTAGCVDGYLNTPVYEHKFPFHLAQRPD